MKKLLSILLLALQENKIASDDYKISPRVFNIKPRLQIMKVEPVLYCFTLSNAFQKKVKV